MKTDAILDCDTVLPSQSTALTADAHTTSESLYTVRTHVQNDRHHCVYVILSCHHSPLQMHSTGSVCKS